MISFVLVHFLHLGRGPILNCCMLYTTRGANKRIVYTLILLLLRIPYMSAQRGTRNVYQVRTRPRHHHTLGSPKKLTNLLDEAMPTRASMLCVRCVVDSGIRSWCRWRSARWRTRGCAWLLAVYGTPPPTTTHPSASRTRLCGARRWSLGSTQSSGRSISGLEALFETGTLWSNRLQDFAPRIDHSL